MEQNKTGKYFKYAIGEIVLVVLGILIALSINNWNENRKDVQLQLQLLTELQETVKDDYKSNQRRLRSNKSALNSLEVLIHHFENNLPYQDSLTYHFTNAHSRWIGQLNETAYENIVNHGLNFIKNDKLKHEIPSVYGDKNEFLKTLDERFNLFYFQVVAPDLMIYFNQINPQGGNSGTMIPLDYDVLSTNTNYMSILRSTQSYLKNYIQWQESAIAEGLNDLSEMLDAEIKRHQ